MLILIIFMPTLIFTIILMHMQSIIFRSFSLGTCKILNLLRCCYTAQFSRQLVSQRRCNESCRKNHSPVTLQFFLATCNSLGRGKLGARIKMADVRVGAVVAVMLLLNEEEEELTKNETVSLGRDPGLPEEKEKVFSTNQSKSWPSKTRLRTEIFSGWTSTSFNMQQRLLVQESGKNTRNLDYPSRQRNGLL